MVVWRERIVMQQAVIKQIADYRMNSDSNLGLVLISPVLLQGVIHTLT